MPVLQERCSAVAPRILPYRRASSAVARPMHSEPTSSSGTPIATVTSTYSATCRLRETAGLARESRARRATSRKKSSSPTPLSTKVSTVAHSASTRMLSISPATGSASTGILRVTKAPSRKIPSSTTPRPTPTPSSRAAVESARGLKQRRSPKASHAESHTRKATAVAR